MTDNRFAQLKENFDKEAPKGEVGHPVKRRHKSHLIVTIKKGVFPSRYIMMSVMKNWKISFITIVLNLHPIIWRN